MDGIGLLVVAIVAIVVIVLVARRWRGDRPGDRGPYSTGMETRAGLAALGKTLDQAPDEPSVSPDEKEG